jgi:hypothetical protein
MSSNPPLDPRVLEALAAALAKLAARWWLQHGHAEPSEPPR